MSISPTSDTAKFAREAIARLGEGPLSVRNEGTGEAVCLPPAVAHLVRQLLVTLAAGRTASVASLQEEMTPNEAAEFLNVSRPHVTKLLDEGVLPYRVVGTHKRIPGDALATYKEQQRARSRKAMDELIALTEEMGGYDAPTQAPPKSAFRRSRGGMSDG